MLRLLKHRSGEVIGGEKHDQNRSAPARKSVRYVMVCVSYRGYWTSKGRPSERGIAEDAVAAVEWIVSKQSPDSSHPIPVVLWGQSIGAGVATNLAARPGLFSSKVALRMVILETPFTNIRDMLVTIYPQKWLPYRYLWPFLRNQLDSWRALEQVSKQPRSQLPEIVILEAGNDELVPKSHGDVLEHRCRTLGFNVQRHVIKGALHTEVLSRPAGRAIVAQAIRRVANSMDR